VSNPWDEPKQSAPAGLWLVVVAAIAFGLGSYFQPSWFYGHREDQQEQVEPTPISLEGVSIVCVVENKTISADETIFFRDKEEFAKKHGLRMILRLDKDLSASEPYVAKAMAKNIEVPFAAFVKDKEIFKVIPLPKTKEELLK